MGDNFYSCKELKPCEELRMVSEEKSDRICEVLHDTTALLSKMEMCINRLAITIGVAPVDTSDYGEPTNMREGVYLNNKLAATMLDKIAQVVDAF